MSHTQIHAPQTKIYKKKPDPDFDVKNYTRREKTNLFSIYS